MNSSIPAEWNFQIQYSKVQISSNYGNFTAEARRAQRNDFLVWRGEAAKQKAFVHVKTTIIRSP